jgi:hypothetical protein
LFDLLFGGLCIILLLVYIFYEKDKPQLLQTPDRILILKQGITVEGTAVGIETRSFRFFDEFPVVQFRTPQGQWLTLTCQESTRRNPGFRKGQKVRVRFLPDSPEQFIVVTGLNFLLE